MSAAEVPDVEVPEVSVPEDNAAGADAGRRTVVLAFDPGRNLGAAWVDMTGNVLRQAILAVDDLERLVLPPEAVVVVGNGTGSAQLARRLRARGVEPLLVDEKGTTLRARELYFRDHPPRGMLRLLPPGMRAPPRTIDDYAAVAIALRWLAERGMPGAHGRGAPAGG